jgi:hypothetical protein
LYKISSRPNCRTVAVTIRSASAAFETSVLIVIAAPPRRSISAATAFA